MNDWFGRIYGLALLAACCGCGVSQAAAAVPTGDAGAAPVHHAAVHHHRRHLAAKPTSPVTGGVAPVAAAAPTTSPAPVPNEAVAAPIDDPSPQTSVAPSVFQLHYPPQGDGYTTGSSSQAMDDREAAKATGVQVKVPLPQ